MKLLSLGLTLFLLFFGTALYANNSYANNSYANNSYANNSTDNGLITKASAYSVTETTDRLVAVIKKKGIILFERINHAQGAKNTGLTLLPTELVIFGKPQLGNPLMKLQAQVAIDLPLKAIIWEDKEGKVWLSYNAPVYIAKRHSISEQHPVIKKMTGALNKLSDYATKAAP